MACPELEVNYVVPVGGKLERHNLNRLERTPKGAHNGGLGLNRIERSGATAPGRRLHRKFEKTHPFQAKILTPIILHYITLKVREGIPHM